MSDWSYFWSWTGPAWLVAAAYAGTFLVAGLVLFAVATVTGLTERVGPLQRIVQERAARDGYWPKADDHV